MAVRIPVVISQHERRSGSIADYEEQLITRIVLESGLDATLIADLKAIALETTDHLCIEGLKGDFALATWESVEYVCKHLHRLGIPSLEIVPVDGSARTNSGDANILAKKIFLISLATTVPIDKTIQTLRSLLVSRATPVFSIGAPIHRNKNGQSTPQTDDRSIVQITQPTSSPLPIAADEQAKSNRIEHPAHALRMDSSQDDDFPNIDELMDELDQFEL